jgi:hypothetical protein
VACASLALALAARARPGGGLGRAALGRRASFDVAKASPAPALRSGRDGGGLSPLAGRPGGRFGAVSRRGSANSATAALAREYASEFSAAAVRGEVGTPPGTPPARPGTPARRRGARRAVARAPRGLLAAAAAAAVAVAAAVAARRARAAAAPFWAPAAPAPVAGSLSRFTLMVMSYGARAALLPRYVRHYSHCPSVGAHCSSAAPHPHFADVSPPRPPPH